MGLGIEALVLLAFIGIVLCLLFLAVLAVLAVLAATLLGLQTIQRCAQLAQPIVRGVWPVPIDVIALKGFRDPAVAAIVLNRSSKERAQGPIAPVTEYERVANRLGDAKRFDPGLGAKGQKLQSGPARAKYPLEQVKGKDSVDLADLAGFKPTKLTLRDNHGLMLRELSSNQIVAQPHFQEVVLAVREYGQECKGPTETGSAEYCKVRLESFVRALRP